jgi:hypothetical protein
MSRRNVKEIFLDKKLDFLEAKEKSSISVQ